MQRIEIDGIRVPGVIYGTAWKEERTAGLVRQALDAGFRGIDTANQRRHYHEAGVGETVKAALASGGIARQDLFLQTKYTYVRGQDHRLPYDPDSPFADQVRQSFDSSLEHLGVDQLDSYVLHGPWTGAGLVEIDREVWATFESLKEEGKTRLIGVSNFSREQLLELYDFARIPPAFVQNRCFASARWDEGVREACRQGKTVYQGFSLLTANRQVMAHPELARIAQDKGKEPAQIVFRFARQVGMIVLTGTTDPAHMALDLDLEDFDLTEDEVDSILGMGVGPGVGLG